MAYLSVTTLFEYCGKFLMNLAHGICISDLIKGKDAWVEQKQSEYAERCSAEHV